MSGVLVGCRSPEEIDDNVTMLRHEIPEGLWSDLADVGVRMSGDAG